MTLQVFSDPYSIDFGADSRGYLLADGAVFVGVDGGHTWTGKNTATRSELRVVCATGNKVATIVGEGGTALCTTPGGE